MIVHLLVVVCGGIVGNAGTGPNCDIGHMRAIGRPTIFSVGNTPQTRESIDTSLQSPSTATFPRWIVNFLLVVVFVYTVFPMSFLLSLSSFCCICDGGCCK